jgi:hypothetical protein
MRSQGQSKMLLSAGTLVIPYGSQKETPGTGVKSLISRVLGRFNFIKIITDLTGKWSLEAGRSW